MKKNLFYLMMLFVGLAVLVSCDDDDDPKVIDNPTYGMQITGTATDGETFVIDAKQIIEPGSDFSIKEERDGMMYGIHYLKAGSFMFKEVTAVGEITYGVSAIGDSTQTAEAGAAFNYKRGKLVADATDEYTVAEAGLYYIITDKTTLNFWIMKINNFEISATGDLAEFVSGDETGATFEAKAVDIRGPFKVRINTSWKIIATDVAYDGTSVTVEDHVRMVTSYGGAIDVMTPDGDDITVDNGGKLLDFTFTWTPGSKGIAGVVGDVTQGAELPPLEFPEQLYMVGGSIGGWSWADNAIEMIPVEGNPHLFWRIVWIESGATDPGIKFCEELDWGKDFGVEGDAVDGVFAKGTANVPDVAESGSYVVVVNLEDETIEVNPAKVYGIGPVFGDDSWAGDVAFTVDNTAETVYSPAFSADGELRMYADAATLTDASGAAIDWWRKEFITVSGVIEYRGLGGDQARLNVTAGQVITLDFSTDTGTIQ